MIKLPEVKDLKGYRTIYRNQNVWLPAMKEICRRHGLNEAALKIAPAGTHVVFKTDQHFIKLFCPLWRGDYIPERLLLDKLTGKPQFPIPQLVAEGEIDGWQYLVITAVKGTPLDEVWSNIPHEDRVGIISGCGKFLADLHSVPVDGFSEIAVDWHKFVEEQIVACRQKHIDSGLDEVWLDDIFSFLDENPIILEADYSPKLLNADLHHQHVLVYNDGEHWQLGGIIDFGDAMLGHPHYDFAAPCGCITFGDAQLQEALFTSYGYSIEDLTPQLANQFMANTLIHLFAKIPDLLHFFGDNPPKNFKELQKELWFFAQ